MFRNLLIPTIASIMLFLSCNSVFSGEKPCFLRNGDRWYLIGDSITDNGTYCREIIEVLKHFHPEAKITVSGHGVSGVASDFKFSIKEEKKT